MGPEFRRELRLSVEDGGPGIAPEQRTRIFEKFYRIPGTPAGGTGLGLSIARSIAEVHGGTIEVSNRSPQGANFEFSLPLKPVPPLETA